MIPRQRWTCRVGAFFPNKMWHQLKPIFHTRRSGHVGLQVFKKKRMRNNKKFLRPRGLEPLKDSVFGFCKVLKWFGSCDGWEENEMELIGLTMDFHPRTSYSTPHETYDFLWLDGKQPYHLGESFFKNVLFLLQGFDLGESLTLSKQKAMQKTRKNNTFNTPGPLVAMYDLPRRHEFKLSHWFWCIDTFFGRLTSILKTVRYGVPWGTRTTLRISAWPLPLS